MKNFTLLFVFCLTTFFTNAQEAQFNWEIDTLSSGNTLKGMTINSTDNSSVIIGYDNTVLKSTDNGATWENKSMFSPDINFVGMDKTEDAIFISSRRAKLVDNPSKGYNDVYVSGVLLKSSDQGKNWDEIDLSTVGEGDTPSTNPNAKGAAAMDIYSVGAYNKDTIIIYTNWYDYSPGKKTTRGGVFRTNDGGATWETLLTGLGSSFITTINIEDSLCYIGGNKKLYILNLNTDSLVDIHDNLYAEITNNKCYVNSIEIVNPDTFYVATTASGVFKTTDGGQTFSIFDDLSSGANDIIALNDSILVTLGSSGKSKYSCDNGATWEDCYPGSTCYHIGGVLADTLYGVSSKSTVYKCAVADFINKNPQWTSQKIFDDSERLQRMAIYDNDYAVIAGFGEHCAYTNDAGKTWNQSKLPDDYEEEVDIDFNDISANGSDAYATVRRFKYADLSAVDSVNDVYMEGLILSTNDNWETSTILDASKIGANEDNDPTLNPQLDECWGLNPYTVKCIDANTAYVYANWYEDSSTGEKESRSRIFKTTDAGESWTGITYDFGNYYINDIEFSNDTGYFAGNKILLKTTDAGESLTDLYPTMLEANGEDTSIIVRNIYLVDGNKFYVATTSDGVFYTNNGGNSFSKFDEIAGAADVYEFDSNSFICMGTAAKSKFTNDWGETWQNATPGFTTYSIGGVLNESLYVLGRGVIAKVALSDLNIATGIADLYTNAELKVAYGSEIVKLISTDGEISKCEVYSLSGKLVSLTEPYSTEKTFYNSNYKSGIYIVKSIVKNKQYINKIVLK